MGSIGATGRCRAQSQLPRPSSSPPRTGAASPWRISSMPLTRPLRAPKNRVYMALEVVPISATVRPAATPTRAASNTSQASLLRTRLRRRRVRARPGPRARAGDLKVELVIRLRQLRVEGRRLPGQRHADRRPVHAMDGAGAQPLQGLDVDGAW